MKKILIISATVLVLVGGFGAYASENKLTQENAVKIPTLFIPGPGQGSAHNLEFVNNDLITNLPNEVPVYKFNNVTVTEEGIKELGRKLGMKIDTVENSTALNALAIEDETKYLEIEKETGKILYINKVNHNAREVNGSPKIIPSDTESIGYATEFLKDMNWLPNNFKVVGVTKNREVPDKLNAEIEEGYILNKSVHLYQHIGENSVLGVSRIIVEVGHNGEIEVVRKYHKEQSLYENYPVKSVDDAISELENGKGIFSIEEGGINPIIEGVDIHYWEDAGSIEEQPFLQPVYVFSGNYTLNNQKADFTAIIPAINNNFTFEVPAEPKVEQSFPNK